MIERNAIEPEDVQREPDGMPHAIIGLTVLYAAMLAMAMLWMHAVSGGAATIIVALIAVPFAVFRLQRMATRDRDQRHPSR